jgi:branched-chain amino acid transport system substrate-binding protein
MIAPIGWRAQGSLLLSRLRHCEKKGGKLINTTIKTYPSISQFWTYDEKWFLVQAVYSRNYPPLKS